MQVERINISIDIGFTLYRLGKDLPCIVFVSGVTDSDGGGYAVLRRILEELKSKTLHGSTLLVPQLNELNLAYRPCTYTSSSSIFCKLVDKLVELIPRECLIVEVRCRRGFAEHILIPRDGIEEPLIRLVEAIPIEYVVKDKLKGFAQELRKRGFNVATVILNCGKEFNYNEVDKGVEVIMGTLGNLGYLKKKPNQFKHRYYEGYYVLRCSNRGIFTPSITNCTDIVAQTIIGTLEGSEVRSPVNGLVLYISQPKLCNIDEVVGVIAIEALGEEATIHQ